MLPSVSIHRTACNTCRLRALIASKTLGRRRGFAALSWASDRTSDSRRVQAVARFEQIGESTRAFSTSATLGARKGRGQGVVLDAIALPARDGADERAGIVGEGPSISGRPDLLEGEDADAAPELTDADYAMLAECVDSLDAAVLQGDGLTTLEAILEPYSGDVRVLAVREVFGYVLPVGLLEANEEERLSEEMYGGEVEKIELGT
ncbi:hypothetical protein LTR95_013679, partial [Oleoguttula sp. CCFEE 5521]